MEQYNQQGIEFGYPAPIREAQAVDLAKRPKKSIYSNFIVSISTIKTNSTSVKAVVPPAHERHHSSSSDRIATGGNCCGSRKQPYAAGKRGDTRLEATRKAANRCDSAVHASETGSKAEGLPRLCRQPSRESLKS
ncbi:hypothetical protein FI667_g12262, partial [Globisporangium splendens]